MNGILSQILFLLMNVVLSLAFIPLLLKQFGSDQTGVFILFISISNISAIGITWLAYQGIVFLTKENYNSKDRESIKSSHNVIFFGFSIYAVLCCIIMLVPIPFIGSYFFENFSADAQHSFRLSLFFLSLYNAVGYLHAADLVLLSSQLRQATVNIFRTIALVLYGLLALFLFILFPRLEWFFLAQLFGIIMVSIMCRFKLYKEGYLDFFSPYIPTMNSLKSVILNTGWLYFLVAGLITLSGYLDIFIINTVSGSGDVTLYYLATKIPDFICLLLIRMIETLLPYFAKLSSQDRSIDFKKLYIWSAWFCMVIMLFFVILYSFLGEQLILWWVGPRFIPHTEWYFNFLVMLSCFFTVAARLDIFIGKSINYLRPFLYILLAELFFRTAFMVFLIPYLGYKAAIVSTVLVHGLLLFWFSKLLIFKELNINWPQWISGGLNMFSLRPRQFIKELQILLK